MKNEWRCTKCGKLLGVMHGERLHIKFSRKHEYIARLPAACTCRTCQTLNELPTRGSDQHEKEK